MVEFINNRTDLRRNIREAKRMYYTRTFDLYTDIKNNISVINLTFSNKQEM